MFEICYVYVRGNVEILNKGKTAAVSRRVSSALETDTLPKTTVQNSLHGGTCDLPSSHTSKENEACATGYGPGTKCRAVRGLGGACERVKAKFVRRFYTCHVAGG